MRVTKEYIEKLFNELNALCFENKLPAVPINISNAKMYLGRCNMKVYRKNGEVKYGDFSISFSRFYEQTEEVLRDCVAHEMIHYYIAYNNIKDTGPHGEVFKQIMTTLNERHGLNITVKIQLSEAQRSTGLRSKSYFVCISKLKDGRLALNVVPRTRLFFFWENIHKIKGFVSCNWYITLNPFFSRYKAFQTLKAYIVTDEIFKQLEDAKELIREGDMIHVKR